MMPLLTVLLSAASIALAAAPQAPTPEEVLARAAAYAEKYHQTLALALADEKADMLLRGFGVQNSDLPGVETAGSTSVRLMKGKIAIVAVNGALGWRAFRDVSEVNNRKVHEEPDRLERLFRESPETALAESGRIAGESARHDVGSVPRVFNVPPLPVAFLRAEFQKWFAFRKTGEKNYEKQRVWVMAFEEVQRPTIVTTSEGDNYPMHGEIWIEPSTGSVVRSQVFVENLQMADGSRAGTEKFRPRITIEVTYKSDPKLGIWVPDEMKELYEKQGLERVTCTTKYTNYKLLPVDPRLAPKKEA